jgi:iron complex outermembrane receptor protein
MPDQYGHGKRMGMPYCISNTKTILVKRTFALLAMSSLLTYFSYAQTGSIKGRVRNAQQQPMAGASIQINGTVVAKTNEQGLFTVNCTGNKTALRISFIGFQTTTATATCNGEIEVVLNEATNELEAVETTAGTGLRKSQLEQPVSIVKLRDTELKRSTGLFLDDAINGNVPGITMQRRSHSGGQQFNIRGYGNGIGIRGVNGNFDAQGSKTYLNGIPVTDAEGITVLDDIDFASLENAEITKGPSGTLYGLAIAGVINLQTQKAPRESTTISQEVMTGSYGLLRTTTRLAIGGKNSSVLLNYGHQNFNGYMNHTGARKDFVNFMGDFTLNSKQSISSYAGYSSSYDARNGELTKAQYANFDYSGNPAYIKNNAHSAVTTFRAGISHTYQFTDGISNTTSLFGTAQSTDQSSAGGWTDKNPLNYGLRSVFNTSFSLGNGLGLSGITGIELQKMNAITIGYAMGTDNTNPTGYNVITSVRSNQATTNGTSSYFTQWTLSLPKGLNLSAGIGFSNQSLRLDDRLWALTNNTAGNTKLKTYANHYNGLTAPSFAINKKIGRDFSVYASYSSGYKAPVSANILIATTGQMNTGLRPEKATQFELGTKGNMLDGNLFYTLAVFQAKFNNKFTVVAVPNPANTATLYTYIVNAGTLNNKGIEFMAKYTAIQSTTGFFRSIKPFANFTYSDFTYQNYAYQRVGKDISNKDSLITENYSGKQVAGTPKFVFNLGTDIETNAGIYGNINYHHRGSMPFTSDGLNTTAAFNLLNAKLGFRKSWGKWEIDAYAGANNMTNTQYYYMVFINQMPDSYLPAPNKANYFGGINLKYTF